MSDHLPRNNNNIIFDPVANPSRTPVHYPSSLPLLDGISQAAPTPFTFHAGPATPVTGTSPGTIGLPFFSPESIPSIGSLTKFQCFLAGNDTVDILLAVPNSNGGFDISVIATKSGVTGLNTWNVGGDFPTTTIPPNSLVGARTGGVAGIKVVDDTTTYGYTRSFGYAYTAASWSGAGNYNIVFVNTNEVQIAWEATTTRGAQTYAINESFGTVKPARAYHNGTAWTYAAGSAIPGATGIANRLTWALSSGMHLQTLAVEFKFDNASGKLYFGKEIVYSAASVDYGTLASIDISTNSIELLFPYNTNFVQPGVKYTELITEFTLVTARKYRIEMIKINKKISIRVTDTVTADTQLFEWTVDDQYGYGYGAPTVYSGAGLIDVKKVEWYFDNTIPTSIIVGDSITEGSGATTHLSGYAGKLYATKVGMFYGDGGVTAVAGLHEFYEATKLFMPKYAIFCLGANNAQSDTERDRYIADMRSFWAACRRYGIIPIVCTVTPNNNAAYQTRINAMNAAIAADVISDALEIIDFNAALGGAWSAPNFLDDVHPNQTGNDLLYARALADQPDAFV